MNLEDQVINLGLARELKALNVKQESLFVWATPKSKHAIPKKYNGNNLFSSSNKKVKWDKYNVVSAWTSEELGKKLPPHIDSHFLCCSPNVSAPDKKHGYVTWQDDDGNMLRFNAQPVIFFDLIEANARGKALKWLIENGYVNPEEE